MNTVGRAFNAYLSTDGADARQPIEQHCAEVVVNNLGYVVLGDGEQVVAVYRKKNNGALRRMRRWPLSLGSAATQPAQKPQRNQTTKGDAAHV